MTDRKLLRNRVLHRLGHRCSQPFKHGLSLCGIATPRQNVCQSSGQRTLRTTAARLAAWQLEYCQGALQLLFGAGKLGNTEGRKGGKREHLPQHNPTVCLVKLRHKHAALVFVVLEKAGDKAVQERSNLAFRDKAGCRGAPSLVLLGAVGWALLGQLLQCHVMQQGGVVQRNAHWKRWAERHPNVLRQQSREKPSIKLVASWK